MTSKGTDLEDAFFVMIFKPFFMCKKLLFWCCNAKQPVMGCFKVKADGLSINRGQTDQKNNSKNVKLSD